MITEDELAVTNFCVAWDAVDILRDNYGAHIRWLGTWPHTADTYRVRIGRRIFSFNDLDSVNEWAGECEGYLLVHDDNIPLFESLAYRYGAKSRAHAA